ncbi:MAG TPA: vWA domain-containing protein [Candidatus Binataceae bacterium]|nr:vWA domain-containing protein [Candidatus Binataceae bacterium]
MTIRQPANIRNLLRRAVCFAGPFPLSVALHVAALLFLIITIHEQRGRELIMVNLEPGGGGGSDAARADIEQPMVPMPEAEPMKTEMPSTVDMSKMPLVEGVTGSEEGGIGTGGGGGIGSGVGPGVGDGFGGFVSVLRRTGLDVALVIDGTGSMNLIVDDVRAKMQELVQSIHRLVPIARVGIVVFGGKHDPMQIQPLTLDPAKLSSFLDHLQARGGDEWEENTYGAIKAATQQLDWKPYARKVIVLVGDSPPQKEDFEPLLALEQKFKTENGTLNTVDVSQQEHERFERAFWLKVHREEPPPEISPLPAFYRQTRSAYQVIAQAGGGEMKSLAAEQGSIDQQMMLLVFGDKWRTQVAAFSRHLAEPSDEKVVAK